MPRTYALIISIILIFSSAELLAWDALIEPFTQAQINQGWILMGDARLTAGVEDPPGQGWLRLTDAQSNRTGVAYYDVPFPSTQGLVVSFEYATWGGIGADGITAFLFDGQVGQDPSRPFRIGGWGGSLGYAQRCNTPGLRGAYLGVGIDEFGNFSNTHECRSGGLSQGLVPDAIAIRGPGDGTSTQDYPFLTGTGTINTNIDCPRALCPTRPTIIGPGLRQLMLIILPQGQTYTVSAWLKDAPDAPLVEIIPPYTLPTTPPATLKFGYAASTGNSYNHHELRNLKIAPPVDLSVSQQTSAEWIVGQPLRYTLSVSNAQYTTADDVEFKHQWPAQLELISWRCTARGLAQCPSDQGTGDPSALLTLPPSSGLTWTIDAKLTSPTPPTLHLSAQPSIQASDIHPEDNALTWTQLLAQDSDRDGLSDKLEREQLKTNPASPDSDQDGLCDGPIDVPPSCVAGEDLNANGVVDLDETDPLNPDTDRGGIPDGQERLEAFTDPLDPSDDQRQAAPELEEPVYELVHPPRHVTIELSSPIQPPTAEASPDMGQAPQPSLDDELVIIPPPEREYVGSGCQSAQAQAPNLLITLIGLVMLCLAGLGRHKTMRAVLCVVMTLFVSAQARAQTYTPSTQLNAQLEHMELQTTSSSPLSVSARVPAHLELGLGATTQYISKPLRLRDSALVEGELAVIAHQARLDLGISLGLWDIFALEANLPLILDQRGVDANAQGSIYQRTDGWGLADPRLSVRATLWEPSPSLAIGAQAALYLPLGRGELMWSDQAWRPQLGILMDWSAGAGLHLMTNLSHQWRPERDSDGLHSESVFRGNLSLQRDLWQDALRAHVGLSAQLQRSALRSSQALAQALPAEAIAGLSLLGVGPVELDLTGAAGIGTSPGVAQWRGALTIRWRHQATTESACQWPHEDFDGYQDDDGCLDPDNDLDGFADLDDDCPNTPGQDRGCPRQAQVAMMTPPKRAPQALARELRHKPRAQCLAPAQATPPEPSECAPAAQPITEIQPAIKPSTAPTIYVEADRIMLAGRIFFETDEATIEARSYDILRDLASFLIAHPELAGVSIEGHTDDQGQEQANQRLSERRAHQVALFLIEHGVEPQRLKTKGYGESNPLRHNATELGRALNRRVEFHIIQRSPEDTLAQSAPAPIP